MGRIIGYAFLGLLIGFGVNLYLYQNTPAENTPWIPFVAVLIVSVVAGGFVGWLLKKRDSNQNSIQTPESGAPKGVVALFKFIGGFVLIAGTFANIFPLAAVILGKGGNPFFWVTVLGSLATLVILFTVGLGSWNMKKWLISILGVGLALGIIEFLIAFVSGGVSPISILELLIGVVIFAIAYRYRNFFTGSYINYPIFGAYIAALVALIIVGFSAEGIAANLSDANISTSGTSQTSAASSTIDISNWQLGTIDDSFDGVNLFFRYPKDFTFDPINKKITDPLGRSFFFLITQASLDTAKQRYNNVTSSEDFTTDSGLRANKSISGTGFWAIEIEVQRSDGPVVVNMNISMPRDPANVLDGNIAMQIAKTLNASIVPSSGDRLRALTP